MNSRELGNSDNLLDFMFSHFGIGRCYFRGRNEPGHVAYWLAVYEFTESLRAPDQWIIFHIIPYFNLQGSMVQR